MILAFTGAGISQASGIQTFMERPDIRDHLHRDFAIKNPEEYRKTLRNLVDVVKQAEPNDAHIALAEYNIPILTMNVDGLHRSAGSESVVELHGGLPTEDEMDYADQLYNKPVLYGDPAPNYYKAITKVSALTEDDIFLVIGASRFTQIAVELREIAHYQGAEIIEIQEDAVREVRYVLEQEFKNK